MFFFELKKTAFSSSDETVTSFPKLHASCTGEGLGGVLGAIQLFE